MTRTSLWGQTPRESIDRECLRRGAAEVVAACIDLLGHGAAADAVLAALADESWRVREMACNVVARLTTARA